jgi:putative membrane protein
MYGSDGYGACWVGGWGIGMMIMMLVWVVLIVLGIYALVRWINNMRPSGSHGQGEKIERPEKKALQILEEAYARGEISREEFFQKREDLTGQKADGTR